ncbi:MAG: hypothetical protein M1831_004602 [Alyxoria varia]|nr:MAG: hypothetical protein M1831_004602 [Alyxoria varia]
MSENNKEMMERGKPQEMDAAILESWAQGYMVGSLIIMAAITIANMRRGVILHKLILLELILGTFMGFFMFTKPPVYGWFLSATAIPLNTSWSLHNVIAWMKTKPFLSKKWSWFYIGTVILAQPYWVVEIYANFTFFNNINDWFLTTRPYEAIFRDPWWLFTTAYLFYKISTHYRIPILTLVVISPRFGVLMVSMVFSIVFIVLDIISVTGGFNTALPEGLNPFWKLAFVFKCLTDSIVLDDFKTALDRLMRQKMRREGFNDYGERHIQPPSDMGTTVTSSDSRFSNPVLAAAHAGAYNALTAEEKKAMRYEDPLSEDTLERRNTAESALEAELDKVRSRVHGKYPNRPPDPVDEELARYGGRNTDLESGLGQSLQLGQEGRTQQRDFQTFKSPT